MWASPVISDIYPVTVTTTQGFPPEVVADRYHIQRELGQGGMGSVYAALDLETKQQVAVKILHPEYQRSGRHSRRFAREVRAIKQVVHPNVVRILAAGEDHSGRAYLVMEWVRGTSLAGHLKSSGPLPTPELYALALGMAEALREAHSCNVIHRDVKPGNVLIEGGVVTLDRVKVCDFGLAKILGDAQTSNPTTYEGLLLGTPAYMPPEQAQTGEVDARSDVYAFGVVLFEAASGRLPFEAETPLGVMMKHAVEQPPSAADIVPTLPRSVSSLIDACLAKSPEDRPQSMEQVVRLLSTEISDAPVSKVLKSSTLGKKVPQGLRGFLGVLALSMIAGALFVAGYRVFSHSLEAEPMFSFDIDEAFSRNGGTLLNEQAVLDDRSLLQKKTKTDDLPGNVSVGTEVPFLSLATTATQSGRVEGRTTRGHNPGSKARGGDEIARLERTVFPPRGRKREGTKKSGNAIVSATKTNSTKTERLQAPKVKHPVRRETEERTDTLAMALSTGPSEDTVSTTPSGIQPMGSSGADGSISSTVRSGTQPTRASGAAGNTSSTASSGTQSIGSSGADGRSGSSSSVGRGPLNTDDVESIVDQKESTGLLPSQTIRLVDVEVIGSISPAQTLRRVRSRLDNLRKCLADEEKMVAVRAIIGFGGRLGQIRFSGATRPSQLCIRRTLSGVRWPRPDTGDAELRFRLER